MKVTGKILLARGFKENPRKSSDRAKIYSKERFDVAIIPDGSAYYTNGGFDYSVQSLEDLEKLYFSIRKTKL